MAHRISAEAKCPSCEKVVDAATNIEGANSQSQGTFPCVGIVEPG